MAYGQIEDVTFNTYDYAIGGKLLVVTTSISEDYMHLMKSDFDARERFKHDTALQMAKFMLENKLLEFTEYSDPMTFTKRVACRAYLAPDEQVRILRVANKIK